MLWRSVVLLALVSGTLPAQHRVGVPAAGAPGGFRPGSLPGMTNPLPTRGTFIPGIGWRPQRNWGGGLAFGPTAGYGSFVDWPGNAGCTPPIFPADLYTIFASGFCTSGYDPPPPTNVIVMPPQPYSLPPAPYPTNDAQTPDFGANPPQAPPLTSHKAPALNDHDAVANESTGLRLYQSPSPPPLILDEYPALIVLKTGGMYSVTKYWVKAHTLYFVTSHGDTLHVSLASVEHVYPKVKQGQAAEK
jgi:hypothetical protein